MHFYAFTTGTESFREEVEPGKPPQKYAHDHLYEHRASSTTVGSRYTAQAKCFAQEIILIINMQFKKLNCDRPRDLRV